LDIHPINPGHVLVVPKVHRARLYELPPAEAGPLFEVARKIYGAIREADVRCEGANIILSDGVIAGQEVPHAHLHIAPRFLGDGHRMGFSHTDPGPGNETELAQVSAKIKARIAL
jgi:histidine triad (HIT) family protein